MNDPKLPPLPQPYRPPLATDVKVTGTYLLSAVDDSNESWSNPEWVSYVVVRVMCLLILIGGVWILSKPTDTVDRDLRIMVTMLAPAAGFKLIESAKANNKRGRGNGNGNGNGNGK